MGVSIRRRGKRWEYCFDAGKIEGKRNRISKCGFKTKKEAEIAGNIALAEYNQAGMLFVPSEITFYDYLDYWMSEYCEIELTPSTIRYYSKRIKKHIKPALGKYKLKALTSAVLQSFIHEKFNEGYSRTSLEMLRGILSKSLSYAVEPLGFIQTNPMIYVRLPSPRAIAKVKTRTKPHILLSHEQITAIFQRFPEEASCHIPMMFAYRAGTRLSESFAIFWEDIDLENGRITVNRQIQWDETNSSWYFTNPKYDSFRTIEIDPFFVALLRREKNRQEKAKLYYPERFTHLFVNELGYLNSRGDGLEIHPVCIRENGELISPRVMQHASQIIHKQLGIRGFDMHSLRVTHATLLAEKGVDPMYLQERLGHKNIIVTFQIYTRLSQEMRERGKQLVKTVFCE